MRCAGVLLVLLLSLSALSASTAEADKALLSDNAILSSRKWLRGQKAMAALGHGDVKKDEVVEGKGAKNTGANIAHVHGWERTVEVTVVGLSGEGAGRKSGGKRKFAALVPFGSDYFTPRTHPPKRANQGAYASARAVHDEGKRSKGSATHVMFEEASGHRKHDDAATVVSDMLRMDYSRSVASRRPINNDAPLDELVKKP